MTPACLARIADLHVLQSIDLGGFGGVHSRAHPTAREWADPVRLACLVAKFHIVRASVEDARCLLGVGPERAGDVARLFVEWGAEVGILSRVPRAPSSRIARARTVSRQRRPKSWTAPARATAFPWDSWSEYLRSRNPLRAGQFGAAVAAHVIEGTGGVNATRMPTMREVTQRLSSLGYQRYAKHG